MNASSYLDGIEAVRKHMREKNTRARLAVEKLQSIRPLLAEARSIYYGNNAGMSPNPEDYRIDALLDQIGAALTAAIEARSAILAFELDHAVVAT